MSATRYEMLTEADARRLEPGATVVLAKGGHITPLALDTLRERRVTVLRDGAVTADESALAPTTPVTRCAVGSDHTGIALRRAVRDHLRGQGLAVREVGPDTPDAVDYPDTAGAVAQLVAHGEVDGGVVIDGAGLGSAIAANKVRGVRAAMCTDRTLARYAREHNGANVLALGATLLTVEAALAVVDVWRTTPMTEARYIRRLGKIQALEDRR
ncbi:MAG: RpiB/LacA/LacB family sugar-phosphate isomerase [Vicinamibacterales bacterium]